MDKLALIFLLIVYTEFIASDEKNASENRTIELDIETPSKVLSRRKRFLVFPEGSSFQLVFEHQNHGFMMIGDIVWFANTAALAWELPSDPDTFYILKDHKKHYGNRRHDSKTILFVDEGGKVIGKKPYKRRLIVNPAFAKRSVDQNDGRENNLNKELTKKDMHKSEMNTDRFKDLDMSRLEFHRETRRSLYEKVEKVFKGFGWNGRECILRLLCETGKQEKRQGTFLEEILRATFTLPKGREFASAAHKEYDIAHGSGGDCIAMYPDCRTASVK